MSPTAATPGRGHDTPQERPGARARELLPLTAIYAASEGARLLTGGRTGGSVRAQRGVTGLLNLGIPADLAFGALHYLVTPAVLIWLWRRHPHTYPHARTWLGTTTGLALAGVACLPATTGLRAPSLHVGWALWCGVMLFRFARDRTVRTLGLLCPVITAWVVLGTGDRDRFDVLTGVAAVVLGGFLAGPVQRANASVLSRRPGWLPPRRPTSRRGPARRPTSRGRVCR